MLGKGKIKIALVGSTSIIGKEVCSLLETSTLAGSEVTLLDSKEFEGVLSEYRGEARLVTAVNRDSFVHSDIIFLCCRGEEAREYVSFPRKKISFVIDFFMRSWGDCEAPVINCNINMQDIKKHQGVISSPHPIALMLSNLLFPLDRAFGINIASINVFSPVSVFGEQAIEELYQQTVNLLNFKEIPKEIFRNQLVFNIIPDYTEVQTPKKNSLTIKISEEILAILGWKNRKIAIKIILVPVFHSYSSSLHIKFQKDIEGNDLAQALAGKEWIKWIPEGEAAATPVGVAGQQKMHLSNLEEDGLSPKGYWLWSVSDHLLTECASNAIKIAEYLVSEKHIHS